MVNTTIVGSTQARGTAVLSCAVVRPEAGWIVLPTGAAVGGAALLGDAAKAAVAKAVAPAYAGARHGSGLAFMTSAMPARTAVTFEQTSRIDDVQGNRPRGPAPV